MKWNCCLESIFISILNALFSLGVAKTAALPYESVSPHLCVVSAIHPVSLHRYINENRGHCKVTGCASIRTQLKLHIRSVPAALLRRKWSCQFSGFEISCNEICSQVFGTKLVRGSIGIAQNWCPKMLLVTRFLSVVDLKLDRDWMNVSSSLM